jgi:hypothetical protein
MRLTLVFFVVSVSCARAQVTVNLNGNQVGVRPTLNFSPGTGITATCSDNPGRNRVDCSHSFNSAIVATHDSVHANENFCDSTNGTTQYTCKLSPKVLTQYALGMTFLLRADATCTAGCSLNIDSLGPKAVKKTDGSTDPGGSLIAGQPQWIFFDGTVFRLLSAAPPGIAPAESASLDERRDVRARRVIGSMDTMTYTPSITLDVTAGDFHKTTTANSAGNATINASTGGLPGQHMWILVANDQISSKTITFGSNLRSIGPLTGSPGKAATLQFVSDGNAWYEIGRSQGL